VQKFLIIFFNDSQLQLFSLQILHCDNIFSAKGLTVNAKLLATVSDSYVSISF